MNLKAGFLSLLILSLFAFSASAQRVDKKTRKKEVKENQRVQQQSNSYRYVPESETSAKKENKSRRKNKKQSFADMFDKQLQDKREEFYERIEANAKRDKKIRRKMEHPMYSDFSYFGHKKPPKKRPVGKRKFCKECGIVH